MVSGCSSLSHSRGDQMNSVVTGWNRGSRMGGVGSVTWYVRRACYITLSSRASGVIAEMSGRHGNITSFFID